MSGIIEISYISKLWFLVTVVSYGGISCHPKQRIWVLPLLMVKGKGKRYGCNLW